ncbi:esterase/lipase family protein [Rhodococcus ruber]|uniref:esterase/lipase family protein n=1 Tax=Rhodococcus ruber TaxID=1830 RepID=UPI0037832BE2
MKAFEQTLTAIATAALSCFVIATASPVASAESAVPPEYAHLGPSPAGANEWDCQPDEDHPRPVVLLHGTGMNMADTWHTLSPQLANSGTCVFALNYGGAPELLNPHIVQWGLTDIRGSAQQLAQFVDTVLVRTRAHQVNIVGHSQGGVVARQYMRFEGGTDPLDPANNKVHSLITLGASNNGTTFGELQQRASQLGRRLDVSEKLIVRGQLGPAAVQQLSGSGFLSELNAGGHTQPGVTYTSIASRTDGIITPPESSFLQPGPSATVDNVWLQDGCPGNTADHNELPSDSRALYLVQSSLDPDRFPRSAAPCTAG